jgi:hypothetical protein
MAPSDLPDWAAVADWAAVELADCGPSTALLAPVLGIVVPIPAYSKID